MIQELIIEVLPEGRIALWPPGNGVVVTRNDLIYALLCSVGTRIRVPCRQPAKGEGNHYGEAG